MLTMILRLVGDQKGQGMVEYGLIIVLVAILLIGGLSVLQSGVAGTFAQALNSL